MQVMVVDDDAVSRLALIDLMNRIGFNDILEFQDGAAAWESLESGPMPVLCCCDVRMPKMSGIELLERVRNNKRLAPLPFVLITSGSERDVVQQAIVLGVSGYIVKPFNSDSALEKLVDIFSKEWKGIAEKPSATAKRLSISADKLLAYYDAFKAQVEQLIHQVRQSESPTNDEQIATQFGAINTGCLTLGLWHYSKQLENLIDMKGDGDTMIKYLRGILSAIQYQISLVRR